MSTNIVPQAYWDSGYEAISFSAMPETYPLVRKIYEHFKPDTSKEIFEIGCFPGRFVYHFGKLGYRVSGIDTTAHLPKMEQWLRSSDIRVGTLERKLVEDMTFEKKYDVVFSSGFIEHFENFKEIIQIHASLTKPGGHVFITAPNFAGRIQKLLHGILDRQNLLRHYLPAMNPAVWKSVLEKEGFDIVEAGYCGGFDFWTDTKDRNLIRKLAVKAIRVLCPIRWLPNSRAWSPEILIIAQKRI